MVAAYDEAEKLALAAGEARARLFARLQRVRYGLDFGLAGHTPDEILAVAREAIPVFEREGDERGLAAAWMGIGDYHRERREIGRWGEAYEHALIHARRSGDRRQIAMTLARLPGTFGSGSTPLDETIARIETELDDPEFPAQPRAVWTAFLGGLEDSRGN